MADAVAGTQQGKRASNHYCRIYGGGHTDVRCHGGGGRLAVCSGDADRVFVLTHYGAPGLRSLEHGYSGGSGGGYLGIIVVYGGGAYDIVAAVDIGCVMADVDIYAYGAQMVDRRALAHIGTVNIYTCAVQYLCQGTHRNSSDAD
ncbi:hypothetical protein SDC9_143633 [bioreactor metagenome]|uniref:Uncharacterized protein n=1 Tax=bioreactor metagenome TaxID=1076179 RepID=A0A645E3Y5_9ZZZZ